MTLSADRFAALDARIDAALANGRRRRASPESAERARLTALDRALVAALALASDTEAAALEAVAAGGALTWGVAASADTVCPAYALLGGLPLTRLIRTGVLEPLVAAWDGCIRPLSGTFTIGTRVPVTHPAARRLLSVVRAYRAAHPPPIPPDHQLPLV